MKIFSQPFPNQCACRVASTSAALKSNFNRAALLQFRDDCQHTPWRQGDYGRTLVTEPNRAGCRITGIEALAIDRHLSPRNGQRRINAEKFCFFAHLSVLMAGHSLAGDAPNSPARERLSSYDAPKLVSNCGRFGA